MDGKLARVGIAPNREAFPQNEPWMFVRPRLATDRKLNVNCIMSVSSITVDRWRVSEIFCFLVFEQGVTFCHPFDLGIFEEIWNRFYQTHWEG